MSNANKDSHENRLATFAAVLLVIVLAGGLRCRAPSHYYQLSVVKENLRPAVARNNSRSHPGQPFSDFTSVSRRPHRLRLGARGNGPLQYERWTEPPSEMLTRLSCANCEVPAATKRLFHARSARGEFILRGHLYDMKEIATGSAWSLA